MSLLVAGECRDACAHVLQIKCNNIRWSEVFCMCVHLTRASARLRTRAHVTHELPALRSVGFGGGGGGWWWWRFWLVRVCVCCPSCVSARYARAQASERDHQTMQTVRRRTHSHRKRTRWIFMCIIRYYVETNKYGEHTRARAHDRGRTAIMYGLCVCVCECAYGQRRRRCCGPSGGARMGPLCAFVG